MSKQRKTFRRQGKHLWQQTKTQAEKWTNQVLATEQGQYVVTNYVTPIQQRLVQWEATWPERMPIKTVREQLPHWLANQQQTWRGKAEHLRQQVLEHELIAPRVAQGSHWLQQVWPDHPFSTILATKKAGQE